MKIWIDLDNSPHVLFFGPIIAELTRRGHGVDVTARGFAQTVELAERFGLKFTRVGRQFGKSRLGKVIGTMRRAAQLWRFGLGRGFELAVSHLSRSQVIAARALDLPILVSFDYEHVSTTLIQRWFSRVLIPECVPKEVLVNRGISAEKILQYPGLKEEVYLCAKTFGRRILEELGLDPGQVILTVRPPSDTAHYHRPLSSAIYERLLERIAQEPHVSAIFLPRSLEQWERIRSLAAAQPGRVVVPPRVVDGPEVLAVSDLVISGGGTMNREAAVIGVPVYSIFCGEVGAVDRALEAAGKLHMVRSVEELNRIVFRKREKGEVQTPKDSRVRDTFVEVIEAFEGHSGRAVRTRRDTT